MSCFVLFCSVLFCFVLFCSVLFCFVSFCSVLFCFVLFSLFSAEAVQDHRHNHVHDVITSRRNVFRSFFPITMTINKTDPRPH